MSATLKKENKFHWHVQSRSMTTRESMSECGCAWVSAWECLDSDDQVRRKRTSLLKVLEKRGGEKGKREMLGYLKKNIRGFFLLPCTQGQICVGWSGEWHLCPGCRVGLCSWLWIEFRCLGCLHLKCFPMNCPASQREIKKMTHFI